MITHILKDGSMVESIAGKVISSKEFPIIYKLIGGDKDSDKSTSDGGMETSKRI